MFFFKLVFPSALEWLLPHDALLRGYTSDVSAECFRLAFDISSGVIGYILIIPAVICQSCFGRFRYSSPGTYSRQDQDRLCIPLQAIVRAYSWMTVCAQVIC